jgi:hypothetical protein
MNVPLSYNNMFEMRGFIGYKRRLSFLVPQPYFEPLKVQDTKLCTLMQQGQKIYSTNELPTSQQSNVQFFSHGS